MTPYNVASHQISYQRQRSSVSGIPLGFERLLHPQSPPPQTCPPSPQPSPSVTSSRFRLHVRQQPVAGRACAAGEKDRRPLDPPPILQMLLVDFKSDSEDDRQLLKDPRFVVGCLLYSVTRVTTSFPKTAYAPETLIKASRDNWFTARILSSRLREHHRSAQQGTAI
jgi:hypothetical protein